MPATYTSDQQVFCLNAISNLGNEYQGTAEVIASQTSAAINNILSDPGVNGLIGNWSCVWGPQVVAAEGKALNTMFIAHNSDSDQYVVAIAGTDSKCVLDWLLEDFLVSTKVDWPYGGFDLSPNPMTSLGTSIGLNALIGMAVTTNSIHVHARDYLQNQAATNVIVTGHSLGGALAPAYALYLNDTVSQWANGRAVTISCAPAAGATPGDQAFSDYYGQRLGATTNRVWNAHDVVPHAFEHDMLTEIKAIFEPHVKTPISVRGAIDLIKLLTINKNYTQLLPATAGFTLTNCSGATTFGDALLCNHICAYADHFQVADFQAAVQRVLNMASPFFSSGC